MAAEHSERPDSLIDFTTSNYSVTTTSEVEWRFVAEPKNAPCVRRPRPSSTPSGSDLWLPPHARSAFLRPACFRMLLMTQRAFRIPCYRRRANGWPTEAKLLIATAPTPTKGAGKGGKGLGWGRVTKTDSNDGSRRRRTMPMEHLMLRVTQRSGQLANMGEPPITLEEAIGARLYTGPMYVKVSSP